MVGDEEEERLGIGRAEVGVDGGEFFFFGAAGVEVFEIADEEDLEGRHEGGGLGAVEGFEDVDFGEVEVGEAEVAEVGRDESLEDGFAAAIVEEDIVADEDVAGTESVLADFSEETVGGCEAGAHWNQGTGYRVQRTGPNQAESGYRLEVTGFQVRRVGCQQFLIRSVGRLLGLPSWLGGLAARLRPLQRRGAGELLRRR